MRIVLRSKQDEYGKKLTELNQEIEKHLHYNPQFIPSYMSDTRILFAEGIKMKNKDLNFLRGFIAGANFPFEVLTYQ